MKTTKIIVGILVGMCLLMALPVGRSQTYTSVNTFKDYTDSNNEVRMVKDNTVSFLSSENTTKAQVVTLTMTATFDSISPDLTFDLLFAVEYSNYIVSCHYILGTPPHGAPENTTDNYNGHISLKSFENMTKYLSGNQLQFTLNVSNWVINGCSALGLNTIYRDMRIVGQFVSAQDAANASLPFSNTFRQVAANKYLTLTMWVSFGNFSASAISVSIQDPPLNPTVIVGVGAGVTITITISIFGLRRRRLSLRR